MGKGTNETREGKGPGAPGDYADIPGNETAKRALQVAAAGGHGILLTGPAGSPRATLASLLPTILPALTEEQSLERARIRSAAGLGDAPSALAPLRAPHHSATKAGLLGGGLPVRPGEASLAHRGVLFLDDVSEFGPAALQMLRACMEKGLVRIARADGVTTFPASFLLATGANPCPCGNYGDPDRECTCSAHAIQAYQIRLGGPLADHIHIRACVARTNVMDVLEARSGTPSAALRAGVLRAREYRSWRTAGGAGDEGATEIVASCRLDRRTRQTLEDIARAAAMDGRGVVRVLSVARTIADIEQTPAVGAEHLIEAIALCRDPAGGL